MTPNHIRVAMSEASSIPKQTPSAIFQTPCQNSSGFSYMVVFSTSGRCLHWQQEYPDSGVLATTYGYAAVAHTY